jgi:SAM-dependent methyltransferase
MNKTSLDTSKGYPEDYHDYVFKDGRFVGAFDEMYRFSKGIPWDQDKRCNDWYAEVGVMMLRDKGPYSSILEMGGGLGYFADKLRRYALRGGGTMHSFDVSAEAVRRASEMHPGIEFWVEDVTRSTYAPRQRYDLVVIRDVFWYVFEHIHTVVENIARSVKPQGHVYVCQSFPALDRPFVGKETIPNPDALLGFFSPKFKPVHSMRLRQHLIESDGPILHFLSQSIA